MNHQAYTRPILCDMRRERGNPHINKSITLSHIYCARHSPWARVCRIAGHVHLQAGQILTFAARLRGSETIRRQALRASRSLECSGCCRRGRRRHRHPTDNQVAGARARRHIFGASGPCVTSGSILRKSCGSEGCFQAPGNKAVTNISLLRRISWLTCVVSKER